MSLMRLTFAGEIKRVEHKNIGDKSVMELSVCRKNYAKQGEEPTFTWIRASVWAPPDWMASKAAKGVFVAGVGEFSLRSYTNKTGEKQTVAEVRCSSYDIELSGQQQAESAPAPAAEAPPAPRKPVPVPSSIDDEPPF